MGSSERSCYVCGDEGYEELLVLCSKCKSAYIHIYCMKTIVFIAPDDWVCDDCEETPKHAASKLTDDVRVVKRTVQFIPTDEAIALTSHSPLPKGGDSRKDTLNANKNAGGQRPTVGQVENGRFLPNPVSSPIWTGCFKFSGFAAPDVVWGYPPVKISWKAYEFTKEMPSTLCFMAIPRCTVWANMFKEQDPDKNHVGLYFSPIGARSERCYTSLVAHLEKEDIVLKSRIRGVQVLIIPSSLLDEESKNKNQASYLWGIFVPPTITFKELEQKQFPSKTNTEPAIEQQTVDMEIDMLGGAPVGRIDIPIPRISHLSCSKTSKATVATTSQAAPETQARPEKGDGEDQCVLGDNQTMDREIDKLGGTPAAKTDNLVPQDRSHPSPPVAVTQVKAEKWDGDDLASPPGFPARAAWAEPLVPPGFEEHGRIKYKTISEILRSEDGRRS